MIRKFLLFILALSSLVAEAQTQTNPDSVAYNLQRQKINTMLAQRTLKFGQYQQSLSQHTGIFGLQTKSDIRHSNDILMDIDKTDDDIYAQVKILLQMTVFQSKQVQDKSREALERSNQNEKYSISFMNAINRLRTDNEHLKTQLDAAERREIRWIVVLVLVLVLIGVSIYRRRQRNYELKR